MTQKKLVYRDLVRKRTVSALTAALYGIGNLREVIRRLRKDGVAIKTRTDYDARGVPFTRYELA